MTQTRRSVVRAASASRATIGEGLAVRGEEVQAAEAQAEDWLRRIRLRS